MFLKISQYFQENTCVQVHLFNKVAALKTFDFIKKRLRRKRFPVNALLHEY